MQFLILLSGNQVNRFMQLHTQVSLPEYPFRLNHQSQVLMMGSCFTENIGRLLERYLFPVNINPFGVTYNPVSVKRGMEALMHKERYEEVDLDRHNGRWFSFDHSTFFSSPDRGEALEKINRSFLAAKKELLSADILVLTWGTSWVYQYKKTGRVVCNCHKIPAGKFTRSRLSTRKITEAYLELLTALFEMNKNLKVLHTVSPVRHWKDGAHGNQLSKASLLLAGDALQREFPQQFFYFPSYEIVMDELRDYRFYAEDMLHTSDQATRYIWEKFLGSLVEEGSRQVIKEAEAIRKMMEHRPLDRQEQTEKQREMRIREMTEKAQKLYPDVDWGKLYESVV